MRRRWLIWTLGIGALALFFQRDNTGRFSSSPSAAGSGAQLPSNSSLNPTPSGTPAPSDPNNAPSSATPRAPSGEAARPAERR